jgi:hypothetical protein
VFLPTIFIVTLNTEAVWLPILKHVPSHYTNKQDSTCCHY